MPKKIPPLILRRVQSDQFTEPLPVKRPIQHQQSSSPLRLFRKKKDSHSSRKHVRPCQTLLPMSKSSSSIEVRTSAPSTTSILDIALLSNQKVLPNEIFQPWKVPPASHQQRHDIYAMTAVRPSAPSTSSSLGIQPRPYYDIFHRTSAPSTSSILGIQPRPYYESQAETFQPWPVPPAYLQQRHDIFAMRPHHLMTAGLTTGRIPSSAPTPQLVKFERKSTFFFNFR